MSWSGVKKQTNIENIKAWCEEMRIRNYTINSQGEIDVDGDVMLSRRDFKELPYKFGRVNGCFDIYNNQNLKFLKNCPNEVIGYFYCSDCKKLDSLEGCPTKVGDDFYCRKCKIKFSKEEVESLCEVNGCIYN